MRSLRCVLVVMPAAVRVVVLMRSLRSVLVVMPAAVRVVVLMRSLRCVLVVMPAAVRVVVLMRSLRSMLVVMPAAVRVVVLMPGSRLPGSRLKRHFVQFFSIEFHPGMVTSGRIHMVVAAAVFSAVGIVHMLLLCTDNRSQAPG